MDTHPLPRWPHVMSQTMLLHTADHPRATAEISALGGRVTQQLTSNILLAVFPVDFDHRRLNWSTPHIPTTGLAPESQLAVEAWQSRVDRTPSEKEKQTDGLKWDHPGYHPPKYHGAELHQKALASAPAAKDTWKIYNDRLTGPIAVGLVIVSCSGGLGFSEDEIRHVTGQTAEGTQWLATTELAADVAFIYEQHNVTIPGDQQVPKTTMETGLAGAVYNDTLYCFHQGRGSESSHIWYNVFDGNSWKGDKQIPSTCTDVGMTAVVYKGKVYCFHQGYGDDKTNIWYNAFDGTSWQGDKKIPNTSTGAGMSAVVYGSKIYCFHQGSGGEKTNIWYNVFDGSNWAGDKKIPNTTADGGMSAAIYEGKIYCFHQGSGGAKYQIWYNTFDGTNWAGDAQIPNVATSSGPSVVVRDGTIFCFHQGKGDASQRLWLTMYKRGWTDDIHIGGVFMSGSPSAVLFGGQTFCLHQGYGNCGEIWYRPFDRISSDWGTLESYESIWRGSALKKLGYDESYWGCLSFANHLCNKYNTTRAYIAFFTKFPQGWFAYAGGARICMQYNNDGWGPDNIYKVFAHETSHIFGAGDEYGSCGCGKFGVYGVSNGNCVNCTPKQVDCIMSHNSLKMCEYTKGQVGWLPRKGLFTFHQGRNNDRQLLYEVWDGNAWWTDRLVPKTETSSRPSAVQYKGKVYCFHHGSGNNGQLWYNVFDGSNWNGDAQVPNTGMTAGPSAVIYNDKIYCFHHGSSNNGELWYNTFDGSNWGGDKRVPDTSITAGPAAVVYNNKIYCFHQGNKNNQSGKLWYNVFDGSNWSGDTAVPNTGMSAGPSVVIYRNKIYCFHQGANNSGELWYNVYDGSTSSSSWAGDVRVPKTSMSADPSARVYENKIYCLYQGSGDSGELRYNVFDGSSWAGDAAVPSSGITAGPTATLAQF